MAAGGRLLGSTAWALGGQLARIASTGLTFVLVARSLGPQQMGEVVAVSSVMWILAPFSGLGFGMLMLQQVSRDQTEFSEALGDTLRVTAITGALLVVVAAAVCEWFLPSSIPLRLIIALAASEILFARVIDICAQAFQAHTAMRESTSVLVLVATVRLAAASLLTMSAGDLTAAKWGTLQLIATGTSAGVALAYTISRLGAPRRAPKLTPRRLADGAHFSIGLAAQSVYNDVDKAMLSRYGSLAGAGLYGTAYKLVEMSFTPVRSLLLAAASRLFGRGAQGARSAFEYSRRLLPWTVGYSIVAATALYVIAPYLSVVLGDEYSEAGAIVRALCIAPVLKSLHSIAADTLGASGHQAIRGSIQLAVGVIAVAFNLALIPIHGVWGAVYSTLAGETLLIVLMWTALMRKTALAAA